MLCIGCSIFVRLCRKCYIYLVRYVLTLAQSSITGGEVMKKSQVAGAAFVAMVIASPVFAADLLKAPAAPLAVPSWNGWYIGGEVGGKWVTEDWGTKCIQGGAAQFDVCPSSIFVGAPDSSATFKTSGVRAGVYAGAMVQVNPSWVL